MNVISINLIYWKLIWGIFLALMRKKRKLKQLEEKVKFRYLKQQRCFH